MTRIILYGIKGRVCVKDRRQIVQIVYWKQNTVLFESSSVNAIFCQNFGVHTMQRNAFKLDGISPIAQQFYLKVRLQYFFFYVT